MFNKSSDKDNYQINKQEFEKNKEKAMIIDVRDASEFEVLKKIPNSINIPYHTLVTNPEKYISTKETIVITICNAGHRSTAAAISLREKGYNNAYVLESGIYGYYKTN